MTRTHRGRAIAVGLALLASSTTGLAIAAPSTRPSTPVTRYVPVIGNAQYLVYAEATRVNPIDPRSFNAHVNLFLLRKHGGPTALGPVGLSAWFYSLSRSNLIAVNGNTNGKSVIQRWNLANGHHSEQVTSETVVAASPNGWLFEVDKPDGRHLMSRSYSGKLVDFGDPLAPGVDFGVTSGPNGFIAFANNFENENGQFTYTAWAHPKRHRTLFTLQHQNNSCASVTAHYAACVLGTVGHPLVLLPLDGGNVTINNGICARQYTVWGSNVGWIDGGGSAGCERGHVGEATRAGRQTESKQSFSVIAVTSAWGRLIVASSRQRTLETLRAAHAKPHTLRRAAVRS